MIENEKNLVIEKNLKKCSELLKYSTHQLVDEGFDEEMVPILKILWKNGIETIASCAGHEGVYWQAYLTFKRHGGFLKYLKNRGSVVEDFGNGICGVFCWTLGKDVKVSPPPEQEAKLKRDSFLEVLKVR